MSITLNVHRFTVEGLALGYTTAERFEVKTFCPRATCALLQNAGIIEGFDQDHNSEPVILFTADEAGRPATGFCTWADFVRTYPLTARHAELLAEFIEAGKQTARLHVKVNRLLLPLRTAV